MTEPSGAPGAHSVALRGHHVDTHDAIRSRHRIGSGDLTSHHLGEVGAVRTEAQVRPHDGFAPEAIMPKEMNLVSSGERTKRLARPPAWMPPSGAPCVPLDKLGPKTAGALQYLGRKEWEVHWEIPSGDQRYADEHAAEKCAGCPAREACLEAALEEEGDLAPGGRFLIRGGMTPKGRWRLAAERAREKGSNSPDPNGLFD